MKQIKRLVLGTRGSALALTQASMVEEALRVAYPDLPVERKVIATTGDRRTDVPLSDVARAEGVIDKGIFLKEIEQALKEGKIDFAVHSLKDMPSELEEAFELSAVLPRAAVEDVLVSKKPLKDCRTVATGSVRRKFMGRRYFGDDVQFPGLRGNVPTRLSKLVEVSEWDAIILAKAGLDRLGLFAESTCIEGVELAMSPLPLEDFVPAAGQGIIGIETRSGDCTTQQVLSVLNDMPTFLCARAERAFLQRLGANCSTPVGVHAMRNGQGELTLRVVLFADGREDVPPYVHVMTGVEAAPEDLARKMWENLQESGFSSMNHRA